MTARQMMRRQDAAPFVPYWMMLADSREIAIDHPDFASISEEEESVTVYDLSGGVEVVDLTLVVSLQYGGRFAVTRK